MKKLNLALLGILLPILINSCSSGSTEGMLDAVPENAAAVVVVDVKTITESAGGSIQDNKIKLPANIYDLIPASESADIDETLTTFKNSGIDVNTFAFFAMDFSSSSPFLVGKINDRKKLINYIEDNGFRENGSGDDPLIYRKTSYESTYSEEYNQYEYVGITDKYAYWMFSVRGRDKDNAEQDLKKVIRRADETPYSGTKIARHLNGANAMAAAVKMPRELRQELRKAGVSTELMDLFDGYLCYTADIKDDKAEIEMCLCDEDGVKSLKQFSQYFDTSAKVSKKALAYLNKDQSLVMACALKDVKWSEFFNIIPMSELSMSDRAAIAVAKEYIEKIDGTVAIGWGLTNGLESVNALNLGTNVLDNMSFTMVVEFKDGKSKGIISTIQDLMDSNRMPYETTKNGFTLNIPNAGTIYLNNEDNFIIVSSNPIKSYSNNYTAKEIDFTDHIGAMGFALNNDNQLMKDFNITNDVIASAVASTKEAKYTMSLQVKGGKGGLIAKLINIVSNLSKQADKIKSKYDMYNEYEGWGEEVVEEVAAEVDDDDYWPVDSMAYVEDEVVEAVAE